MRMRQDQGHLHEGLLWLALVAALSPVLADLATHLIEKPWTRYVLVFPVLSARAIGRRPGRMTPERDGILLLLLALGLELGAIGGGVVRLGRVGIPLAALGMARFLGSPLLPVAALTIWWIPAPDALVTAGSPALESGLLASSAAFLRGFGMTMDVEGPRLVTMHGTLTLEAAHGGLPLVALLSGFGWYAATLRGRPLRDRLAASGAWALVGLPVQAIAVLLAALATSLGAADAARCGLSGLWLATATLAWAVAERGARPTLCEARS